MIDRYPNPRRGRALTQVELNMAMYSATHATKAYFLQDASSDERRALWRATVEMWHTCARPVPLGEPVSHRTGLVILG